MTPQMRNALEFIAAYWRKERCSPTYREIQEHMGIASAQQITDIVRALSARGYITRKPYCARSLRLAHVCPHCGEPLSMEAA